MLMRINAPIICVGGRLLQFLGSLLCLSIEAAVLPGTRMDVDWPAFVSGHDLVLRTPPQNTIHGLLLGNGDIGVSVYGAPECITLQVGKNDIWDYRDPVQDLKKTLKPWTYQEVLERYTGTSNRIDAVSKAYMDEHVKPYHMPKPAGQIRFRNESLRGNNYSQRLRLWDAEVTTDLGSPVSVTMRSFVTYQGNLIVVQYTPGRAQEFDIELARHKDTTGTIPNGPEFGATARDLWLRYHFPASEPYPNGFDYVMYGRVLGGQVRTERREGQSVAHVASSSPVLLVVAVETTRDTADPFALAKQQVAVAAQAGLGKLTTEHRHFWHSFWQRSFVQIPNAYVNRHWFLCYYHLACCARAGKIMPGLDGNWSWEDNPVWFAAYYWNTCTENLFYGAYSGNHLEQAIPYNETVVDLLPAAQKEAREIYGMRGAKFPHTTYPHTKNGSPVPFLPYDFQISETPWTAQQLWWYYLYSQDKKYLRTQGYPVLREVATFFEDYLRKAPDGKYDIYPTFSPEHWGLTDQFKYNRNCIVDLSLIKYVMRACISASEVLDCDADRRALWRIIADSLREYPTAEAPGGKVFVDVENAPYPYITYNLPCPTMAIFPGDDIGLHSPTLVREVALRTIKALHDYPPTQGYVMLPMASVRLGLDGITELETHTRRRSFLNGAVFTDCFRWIWAENFGAPIVVNDSIMQGYTGTLRIAPVELRGGVRFGQLRAVGAFLVSGEIQPNGDVSYLAIHSEAGKPCSLYTPWAGEVRIREFPSRQKVPFTEDAGKITFATEKGTTYVLDRPQFPWENQPTVVVTATPAHPETPKWYPIQFPGGWNLTPASSGNFFSTPPGATMDTAGAAGATSGWELPTLPIDTDLYTRLEAVLVGQGNGRFRLETHGGNGGEIIAAKEWTPLPETLTALELDLPKSRTVVAVSVLTTTLDGGPVECRIHSLRFKAADGLALNLDLDRLPAPPPVAGKTYYVSPQGHDAHDGLGPDPSRAWATMDRGDALGLLRPGDTVVVLPGTYRVTTTADAPEDRCGIRLSRCSGTPRAPITYQAQGRVVLDCGPRAHVLLAVNGPHNIVLDGFRFQGGKNSIQTMGVHNWEIRNCWFADKTQYPGYPLIWFFGCGGGIKFHHNVVQGNPAVKGIGVRTSGSGLYFHNTLVGTAGQAFYSEGKDVFKNNIIFDCQGVGIYGSSVTNAHNLLTHVRTPYGGGASAGPGEVTTEDPGLLDDLRLAAGSPAIDAGVPMGLPFKGVKPDMGAFETE